MRELLTKLKLRLSRDSFIRNVAVLAGGTALGQGLVIISSPFLTRLYTPNDFGVLAVYASFLGIISVVASLRYEQAIPLPARDQEAVNLLVLALCLTVIVSSVVGLSIWIFPGAVASTSNSADLRPFLWLLPIGILGAGMYQAFHYWAVREKAFGRIASTKFNQGLGSVAIQVGGGLLTSGPLGLIVGQVIGQAAGIVTLARQALPIVLQGMGPVSAVYRVSVRYRQFFFFGSPGALLNSAGLQLPSLLLASFYGAETAGWYILSRRVFGAPLDLIGRSVGHVYLGEAADLARTSVSRMRALFLRSAIRLLLLGLVPVLILALLGPTLFTWIFGGAWEKAGVYAQLLSLMFLAQFVMAPLSQTFVILERQDYTLALNALKTIIAVVAFWLPHHLALSAQWAILFYSLAMFIYYALAFLASLHLMNVRARKEMHV